MARFSRVALFSACSLRAALLVAGKAEAPGAGGRLVAEDGSDDLVALLQQEVRAHRRSDAVMQGLQGRLGLMANLSKSDREAAATSAFDCSKYPELCKEPFNCHKATYIPIGEQMRDGVAPSGEPNFNTWCIAPVYTPYINKCVAGDLDGAGQVLHDMTKAGTFGPMVYEMDASYCFIDGFCVDEDVTNDTTIEEATAMCDKRFGREAWSHALDARFTMELMPRLATKPLFVDGFTSNIQTRPFLLMACAMGNYHCDARYCKTTYCKDPHFIQKYGHFLKEYGWVK